MYPEKIGSSKKRTWTSGWATLIYATAGKMSRIQVDYKTKDIFKCGCLITEYRSRKKGNAVMLGFDTDA